MKTISEILKPRESVFSDTVRDDVLNLSDFADGKVDADKFFSENFETQGMKMLFDTAFKRFRGQSDTGVIKLTQAMGGGKTHSMLALALLADNEYLRGKILGDSYKGIGKIKVVTFSGRENAEFGIWGSIAEQLGKKEQFSKYYQPLQAPGERAWIQLLQEDKILILLDELPPYLENAKSIPVGNSDLSRVTIAALANLFSALGKEQLSNVCLVFSDLRATYESGSDMLQSSFKELEAEANRIAIEIAPVALNSDEIYSILRKRLFKDKPLIDDLPMQKNEIAIAFKNSVENAKKLGFTAYQPETVYKGIVDSYPFHPSIKDLYARFKENQNFQQTRGLIKLMRQIVREFYESGQADKSYLINVFDVNLNNPNMLSQFRIINSSLEEAISHDIAQEGRSVAEIIDEEVHDKAGSAQQLAKLLLVSSLSTAQGAIRGLTEQEAFGYLCAPGVNLNAIKAAMDELRVQCWYIKADNRGRVYFQNTKNMVAEMNTLVDSYTNENAKKELRNILKQNFKNKVGDCYQLLYVLPAVDEIHLEQNKVALVIFEPYAGTALHPDLLEFYNHESLKNRVMFLSGGRDMMNKLYENSKKYKAIEQIIQNMDEEGTPAIDQQRREAEVQHDKALQALLSTIRETFVTLFYPTKNGIVSSDIKFEFKDNHFDGEDQVRKTLTEAMKFDPFSTDEDFLETMRKKCEARLFTTKEMQYSQILDRAATTPAYEFTLSVHGIGGRVYYDIGGTPTEASTELTEQTMTTKEPELYFACIDPSGERDEGEIFDFVGEPPIRYGERESASGRMFRIEKNPNYEIRYTTDGSESKDNGGVYYEEFSIPANCRFIRIAQLYHDKLINSKDVQIEKANAPKTEKKIDEERPLVFTYNVKRNFADTEETYRELDVLEKIPGLIISNVNAYIYEKADQNKYVELQTSLDYEPDTFKAMIDLVRETSFSGKDINITFSYKQLHFSEGRQFNNWVELCKLDLKKLQTEGNIRQ